MESRSFEMRPIRLAEQRAVLGVIVLLCVFCTTSSSSEPTAVWSWDFIGSLTSRGETPRWLASGSRRGIVAAGDDAGVSVLRDGRRERASIEGVRDLGFDRTGTLWIATDHGLYRWAIAERPVRRTLHGGERANQIHRLLANTSGMLVATEAGAFWSTHGRIFQPILVGGTAARVALVAMECRGSKFRMDPDRTSIDPGLEMGVSKSSPQRFWILRGGQLYEVRGFILDSGMRIVDSRVLSLPRISDDRQPVDLVVDPEARSLYLVFEDMVASRSIESSDEQAVTWKIDRPVLPPGAVIQRLVWGPEGRRWISTDRGLLVGTDLEHPFVRARDPEGGSECKDIRAGGTSPVTAVCRRGIYQLIPNVSHSTEPVLRAPQRSTAADGGVSREPTLPRLEADPPLAEIRVRAMRRAGLDAERFDRLREGLQARAYWPDLSLRLASDFDQDQEDDSHQSFVSGGTRALRDQKQDQNMGFAVALNFDWDLGGIAYPEDSVDLSRELRQVISLRDDVADEINQLYFERQGIRERLAGEDPLDSGEAARLRLRAGEIEAGLDAWTGGWLTRWRSERRDESPPSQHAASRKDAARSRETRLGPDDPVERKYEW